MVHLPTEKKCKVNYKFYTKKKANGSNKKN